MNRERRERSNEVKALEQRIRALRYAAGRRCGIVVKAGMSDETLIERLTGGDP